MHVVNAAVLEQWNSLSDEQVVGQILAGHTALFEILMRRHNERLYRAARAIVLDDSEAEDVMQQAYVNAYTHLRQFDNRAAFATWLTRIAVNEAISRARRQGRYQELTDDGTLPFATGFPLHTSPTPEKLAFSRELRVILEEAVDTLADGMREVFLLRQIEGLTTAETAASLGVSEEVVKTRLSRARRALRDHLFERVGASAASTFTFERPRCDRIVAAGLARIAGGVRAG
jgi:RNA polymerase sigma-70 factor, ECF subfamily